METLELFKAAQDARLYRIAARDCRRHGMTAQARRMEANARAAEKRIIQAAGELVSGPAETRT